MPYVETSAEDSSNIEQAFETIVDHMMRSELPSNAPTLAMEPVKAIRDGHTSADHDSHNVHTFKVVVVGESGVGKSSLVIRLTVNIGELMRTLLAPMS